MHAHKSAPVCSLPQNSVDGSETGVLFAHLIVLTMSLWVYDKNPGEAKGTLQRYHATICQLDAAAQVQIY